MRCRAGIDISFPGAQTQTKVNKKKKEKRFSNFSSIALRKGNADL